MNEKTIRLIWLARRAGKCTLGASATEAAIKQKRCFLVIIAANAGGSTRDKFVNLSKKTDIQHIFCEDRYELGKAVGYTEKSVIGITDKGFAKGVSDYILDMEVSEIWQK